LFCPTPEEIEENPETETTEAPTVIEVSDEYKESIAENTTIVDWDGNTFEAGKY